MRQSSFCRVILESRLSKICGRPEDLQTVRKGIHPAQMIGGTARLASGSSADGEVVVLAQ